MREPVFFDAVESLLLNLVEKHRVRLQAIERLIAIRDIFGRIRFFVDGPRPEGDLAQSLRVFAEEASEALGPRAYPPQESFLFRDEMAMAVPDDALAGRRITEGPPEVLLVDRQVTGGAWRTVSMVAPSEGSAPRLAFYSLKGGVGRSTAAAVVAWSLAKRKLRVLVLDLDLEAPGLSTSLLPPDRQPELGIVDWFVEDTVGQGGEVLNRMVSTSPLARDFPGDIWVVPVHGAEPGDYLAKLGRCYLDIPNRDGPRVERWEDRLARLVGELERHLRPDVVLLDTRAGLGDLSAVPVNDLQAQTLLFAVDTDQTWAGYRLLFEHWRRTGAIVGLRERLHLVAALVPETERAPYLDGLRERAWDLFREYAYDEVEGSEPVELQTGPSESEEVAMDLFSFDLTEEPAPHAPIPIYWNRGFASLGNLHALEETLVAAAFGPFLQSVGDLVASDKE